MTSMRPKMAADGWLIVEDTKSETVVPRIYRAFLEGSGQSTIRDLARSAGVSEGALYRHFSSKHRLTYHLRDTHVGWLTEAIERLLGEKSALQDRIAGLVNLLCSFCEEDPDLFGFVFDQPEERIVSVIERFIEDGRSAGQVDPRRAPIAAHLVLGLILSAAQARRHKRVRTDLRGWTETLTACCMDVLRTRRRSG